MLTRFPHGDALGLCRWRPPVDALIASSNLVGRSTGRSNGFARSWTIGGVSRRLAAPDKDMQASSDDWYASPLVMEGFQPRAALGFGDRAHLGGHLGGALSHVGVETLHIGLERKEA